MRLVRLGRADEPSSILHKTEIVAAGTVLTTLSATIARPTILPLHFLHVHLSAHAGIAGGPLRADPLDIERYGHLPGFFELKGNR